MLSIESSNIWVVIVGFMLALILTLGIGANDVANTFGTSVGSKVLTLRQACILATIFETLGAVLLGAKVSDTVRKGILDVDAYKNDTELFMVGNVAALGGSGTWLVIATILKLPVSGTHSIIGAIMGFTLVAKGANGVSWATLGTIIASWFVSPVLSGLVSTGLFFLVKNFILNKEDPLEPGLRFLPIFYAFTLVVNVFSIFFDGPEILGFDRIPVWGTMLLSFGTGAIVGIVVRVVVVPWQRKRIIVQVGKQIELENKASAEGKPDNNDPPYMNGDVPKTENVYTTSEMKNGDANSNGWVHAKLNPVYENDDGTTREVSSNNEVPHKRHPRLSLSLSGHDDGQIQDPTTIKAGIIRRIRRISRTMSNTEDSMTLTDNEEIDRYVGNIDGHDDDDDGQFSSSPPDSPVETSPKESPLSTVLEVSNAEIQAAETEQNQESKVEDAEKAQVEENEEVVDRPETARLFSFLQILTAIFGAFAHGGNDVSNAIGPVVSIWLVATTGDIAAAAATPIWILFLGGVGISVGLWIWGRRVIETMGQDLSTVTPSSGFCIEIGSALTVLVASNLGVPISSTHCKVGSIVFVGRARSKSNVDWKLFRNIVLAWIITLPASGLVSAALMALLQLAV